MKFGENDNVKIDIAHANLIKGLVESHKPNNVLELGIGGGASTDAILSALEYNQKSYLFNMNSRTDERCYRGLLVIFKNK